jgi:hypothetical protein
MVRNPVTLRNIASPEDVTGQGFDPRLRLV